MEGGNSRAILASRFRRSDPRLVVAPGKSVWVGWMPAYAANQPAIRVCSWEAGAGKVWFLWHRAIQPSRDNPIDFERDIAVTLREL
jgi:hypothetical protein